MATTLNPFVGDRPRKAASRCSTMLSWPKELLPALWSRFVADIRGPARPHCPDCGSAMILRQVKYGMDAGKEFWDCSNFLRCSRRMDYDTGMVVAKKSPFCA